MPAHINEFLKYAVNNNDKIKENFNNTFIIGVSMGGCLARKFTYACNGDIKELGIIIRGMNPVYHVYWMGDKGIDKYLNYVDSNGLPCLLVICSSDIIIRCVVEHTRDA